MVSKLRTHKRFSFHVRMKRSATPLPSGARTTLGDLSIPKNATSCWKSSTRSFEPWSWRRRSPSATPSPMGPKRSRTTLANRLQGLKPGATLGRMETDALGRTVIDGHADAGRPLADRHRGRHVRPPHHVGGRRGDRSIMCLRAVCMTRAVRGLEAVLPHQPSHPFLRGADPLDPQLRPRFPVPFAMKR